MDATSEAPDSAGGDEDRRTTVIVGGGAGGLELACRLGRQLGPRRVVLVEPQLVHVWKPMLHEVAAGTLDIHQEGLSYELLARDNGFVFCCGSLQQLHASRREITVAAVDDGRGGELIPARTLRYGELVLAIGSVANHFGVPGAAAHSLALDRVPDAERCRLNLLRLLQAADLRKAQGGPGRVQVVIVGGGATGVELAAELCDALQAPARQGLRHLDPAQDLRVTLLEAGPRLLAALPPRVAQAATALLQARGVDVRTDCPVARLTAGQVEDHQGRVLAADLVVWAAGIQASPLLAAWGLPCVAAGRLLVTPTLAVHGVPHVHALGDCAACPMASGAIVPARAQAAQQQASYLARRLLRLARGRALDDAPFEYRDRGALVALGTHSPIGSLFGRSLGAHWFVRGPLARLLYAGLRLQHQRILLGMPRALLLALVRRHRARVKLH